jgi:choline dehydrogenase-like flavoprotein
MSINRTLTCDTLVIGGGTAGAIIAGRLAADSNHPVGSCKMGTAQDQQAVVDAHGKVHGVANLYVADASIMPVIPRANTNLPTAVVAERIAGWLQ